MAQNVLVGIDIGGTKIRVATASQPHKILQSADIPTPREFAVAQQLILEQIRDLAAGQTPVAIGVASPAPVDTKRGTIGKPTHLSWHRAPIIDWLNAYYPVPAVLVHDTQAGGICEARYGSGIKFRYILYVSISTGIGSTLILDGLPLPGPHNPEGGRILISDKGESFEKQASGRAIVKKFGVRAAELHRKKDWDAVAYEIADGLYNLIVATDPEVVVLGGGVSVHFKKFIRPLKKYLLSYKPMYPLPPIKQATYTEYAPLIGCMAVAADALKN